MFPFGTAQNRASALDSLTLQHGTEDILQLSSGKEDSMAASESDARLGPPSLQQLQQLQQLQHLRQLQALQNVPVNPLLHPSTLSGSSSLHQLKFLQNSSMDRSSENSEILAALLDRERLRQEAQLLSAGSPHLSLLSGAQMAPATNPGLFMNIMSMREALAAQALHHGNNETMPSMIGSNELDSSLLGKRTNASISSAFHRPDPFKTNEIGAHGIPALRDGLSYFDASTLDDPDPITLANRRKRGGVSVPFPEKLHELISDAEANGQSDVISFFPHGRAFVVHNVERFKNEIMPNYFKQSRYSSFQRQLNLYGFSRITQGRDSGGYYHEYFLRGRPALAIHMKRVGFPKGSIERGNVLKPTTIITPDFYSWAPITNLPNQTTEDEKGEEY
mmetsp:Transcript_383/g.554  ORF Transcript_383/g.554 Transcript_383/m.554 type:complete len:391 (+) Transcript_383:166-1338(+)|eukprot:CAMPEP_0194242664 /NCGR_PEP_ID=MMETSP0158-20130606/8133_1 /TAXON_ID=33649 /ORGANISM="Thalassionema nitzschioides, Strain L26-B" /LENGTH=390 /DNA_ID=CAMNT_0038977805 /DNA_START=274 /DNA_END=1449 /DNA_ORIENTATION=+